MSNRRHSTVSWPGQATRAPLGGRYRRVILRAQSREDDVAPPE